jgi:hypothetical protein
MTEDLAITRPFSKMNRLCAEAAKRRGALTSHRAVAAAIGLSTSRMSQLFGYAQERSGVVVRPETVGLICAVFTNDGVPCEVDWLHLDYKEFTDRLGAAGTLTDKPTDDALGDWELRETTVLGDLVELRLHPPRAGNEVKDSYYVEATLLFGTAICEYDPEDGEEPRAISIALRNARLSVGSGSYRPLQGSMIGERIESDNFSRVAGGIEIIGPAPSGTLHGNPIGDHHLAVVAATNADDGPFAVTVAAHRRSFVVTDVDAASEECAGEAPADNKNVILNEFIYKRCRKDEAGRAVLAQATIKRRTENDEQKS